MTDSPRHGIASLAVTLLCGLTTAPAHAAPASTPTWATSTAPAHASPTHPVRMAAALASTPTRATSVTPAHGSSANPAHVVSPAPAHATPAHATSAYPAHAAPAHATSANPASVTPAHATPARPTHAISPAPAHAIPAGPVRTALTPASAPARASSAAPGHATPTRATSATLADAPLTAPLADTLRLTTPVLPPPPLPDDRAGDHLTLVVHGAGVGRDGVRQLFCHPEAGDHADPTAACRVLDENTQWGRDVFAPVPPDSVCTMIDGGPATAHVTGYWAGRPVDAEFSRRNGCEIARWDRLVPFLPGAGA
ncbi:SSI family serine proteinase inhibitor [Streptomyces bauhiniae]